MKFISYASGYAKGQRGVLNHGPQQTLGRTEKGLDLQDGKYFEYLGSFVLHDFGHKIRKYRTFYTKLISTNCSKHNFTKKTTCVWNNLWRIYLSPGVWTVEAPYVRAERQARAMKSSGRWLRLFLLSI